MSKYLLDFPDDQRRHLDLIKARSQLSLADILRSIIAFGLQDKSLNKIFPVISGQLYSGEVKPWGVGN